MKEAKDSGVDICEDGPHHILECSMCGRQLMDIWVTKPKMAFTCKYKAKCPWCTNEYSFVKEITGGIKRGGIHVPNPDNPEDDIAVKTVVENFDYEGDVIVFNVRKGT